MEASIPFLSETARPMGGTSLFWWVMDGVLVQLTSPVQDDSSGHGIIASFNVFIYEMCQKHLAEHGFQTARHEVLLPSEDDVEEPEVS